MLAKDAIRLILEHSCLERKRQRVYKRNWAKIESARLTVAMAVYDIIKENRDLIQRVGLEYTIQNTLLRSFGLQRTDSAYKYMTELCVKVYADPVAYEEKLGCLRSGKEAARFLNSKKQILKIDTALYACMWEIITSGSLASTMWKITLEKENDFTFMEYCIANDLIPWLHTHPKYQDVYDVVLMGIDSYRLHLCRYCNRNIKDTKIPVECRTCKSIRYCSKTCKHIDSKEEIGHVKLECELLLQKRRRNKK